MLLIILIAHFYSGVASNRLYNRKVLLIGVGIGYTHTNMQNNHHSKEGYN